MIDFDKPAIEILRDYFKYFSLKWDDDPKNNNVLLLLLYAVRKGYDLIFPEHCLGIDSPEASDDAVLRMLLDSCEPFPGLQKSFQSMKAYRDDLFITTTFPRLLSCIEREFIEALNMDKNFDPPFETFFDKGWEINEFAARNPGNIELANTINSLGIKSVLDTGAWFSLEALNKVTDSVLFHILGNKLNKSFYLFSIMSRAASGRTVDIDLEMSYSLDSGGKYISAEQKADAIVFYIYDSLEPERQIELSRFIETGKLLANRFVLLRVSNRCLGSFAEPSPFEENVLSGCRLFRVDKVPSSKYCTLLFDLEKLINHDIVEFRYGDVTSSMIVERIPYEDIVSLGYHLYPELYVHPDLSEGEQLMRIGDFSQESVPQEVLDIKEGDEMMLYRLSSQLDVVCSPSYRPTLVTVDKKLVTSIRYGSRALWSGKNIHIGYAFNDYDALRMCISHQEGAYVVDDELAWSLMVDEDKVSTLYLAYMLSKNEYLKNAFIYLHYFDYLRFYKVPIPDRKRQEEIVEMELVRLKDVVNSDGVYRVVTVGPDVLFGEDDIRSIEGWNVLLSKSLGTVSALEEFLEDQSRAGVIDAIIIDPMTDASGVKLKGLRRALKLRYQYDIPIFVYSSIPEEYIKDDLDEEDYAYCKDAHLVVRVGDDHLRTLIRFVRDELDNNGSLECQIRARYVREFHAAEIVGELFDENVTPVLVASLMKPCASTISNLRPVAEALLKKMAQLIAPEEDWSFANGGWLADFFNKGAWDETQKKNRRYILSKKPMEKTLSESVVFMYNILNGASHPDGDEVASGVFNVISYLNGRNTSNIPMAAIHIFMEFLVFLADTKGIFDVTCTSRAPGDLEVDIKGVLRKVNRGEYYVEASDYRYGKILFCYDKKNFRDGTPIRITAITEEIQRRPEYKWRARRFESE